VFKPPQFLNAPPKGAEPLQPKEEVMKIAVLSHADADGRASAYSAHVAFGADHEMFYKSVQYGEAPPLEELLAFEPDQVYILDFSYSLDVTQALMNVFNILTIDHHRSAEEALGHLPYSGSILGEESTETGAIFDMSRSGCVMAWEHFNPELPVPEMLHYIQDRDLWRWELEHSAEINAYIGTLDLTDFDSFEDFYLPGAYDAGKAVLAFQARQVASRVKKAELQTLRAASGYKGGVLHYETYEVPTVCSADNISEVGNELCKAYPNAPFSVTYCDRPDGKRSFSLRSIGDFDVSEVAKAFGGGGHFHSGGFTLPSPPIF
jgi:oligoribonuclease NrnB/cAMP/cGMP phosphodiesterase (DHH superfamily)